VAAATVTSIVTASGWILWALLRSAGASRHLPSVPRPPMCEHCGYNLSTIALDSRCPECGVAVADSLSPDSRPGTAWEHRRTVGRGRAYLACAGDTLLRPVAFGRTIRLTGQARDHRRFLALHLAPIWLFGATAILTVVAATEGLEELRQNVCLATFMGTIVGTVCVLGAVLFTIAAAASVGFKQSLREQRNVLCGTTQFACYLSAYMTFWALVGALVTVAVILADRYQSFRPLEDHIGIRPGVLVQALWTLPNASFAVGYYVLLQRGIVGFRYANR
jgi:hypothetical protein